MMTLTQVRTLPPVLLNVNDILPVPLDLSYPGLCKDVFNKVAAKEITFKRTYECFLWELRPCQHNIYARKVQWILDHLSELSPIVVMDYGKHLFIIDGHHRVCATHLLGLKVATCHVVKINFAESKAFR